MKKLIFAIFIMAISCLATTNHPSKVVVDGQYEVSVVDSVGGQTLFGSLASGLDTLDGADSVKVLNNFSPKSALGWEYIFVTNAFSGDSASTAVVELLISAYDKNDSLIKHTVVDTFTAGGESAILIPFGTANGYIGSMYDMWIKSPGASAEILIQKLWFYKRRIKQIYNQY